MQSNNFNEINLKNNGENLSRIEKDRNPGELFDQVWKENRYKGFSHQTVAESKTPFLNLFIGDLSNNGATVVELGAGSFDHAFRMAKENSIIKKVIGIEYSQTAVDDARKRANQLEEDVQSRLQIQCGDLFTFFKQFDKNSLDGIYANSVFHFLTPLQRKDLYQECYQLLKSGGIIGVSFKFQGDALFKRGEIIEKTDAGTIIRDSNDNITRLFVSPSGVDVLANEIELAGFEISAIIRWSVPNYNIDGDQGLFVGFLGKHK